MYIEFGVWVFRVWVFGVRGSGFPAANVIEAGRLSPIKPPPGFFQLVLKRKF
jgi:hypothetical protein